MSSKGTTHLGRLPAFALGLLLLLVAVACGDGATQGDVAATDAADAPTEQPATEPPEPESIKVLYTPAFTGHLPPLIAEDAGVFDAHGLDVELIASDEPLSPLLSGDVDIALPAPAVAVVGVAQGQELRILMSIQGRITQKLLVSPEIADGLTASPGDYPAVVAELEGTDLGVSVRGGSVDLNLRYMLQEAGLTPDEDVNVVAAGGGGPMIAALREGQVDGILGFPPLADILLAEDEAVQLIDLAQGEGPEVLDQPFVVAAVTDEFLSARGDVARRFVEAMVETMEFSRDPANAEQVTQIVAARLEGVDASLMDGVVAELISTMDPAFTEEHLAKVNELQNVLGVLDREVTPDEIIATDFVPTS